MIGKSVLFNHAHKDLKPYTTSYQGNNPYLSISYLANQVARRCRHGKPLQQNLELLNIFQHSQGPWPLHTGLHVFILDINGPERFMWPCPWGSMQCSQLHNSGKSVGVHVKILSMAICSNLYDGCLQT